MVELVYRKTMATNTIGEDSLQGIIHDTVSTLLEQTNQSECDQQRRNYTRTLSQAAVQHMEFSGVHVDINRHTRLLASLNPSTFTPGFRCKSMSSRCSDKWTWDNEFFGASDHVFVAAVCLNLVPIVIESLAASSEFKLSSFCFGRPFHAAAYFGHVELFTEIFQGGLKKEKENDHRFWNMLLDAARQGHETIVRYMYSREDVFHDCRMWDYAIIAAAKGGHMNILRFLLTHFTDFMSLDYNVQLLLWAGVNNGHLDIVNLALETGLADINRPLRASEHTSIREGTVLQAAISHRYDDIVRRLIQVGAIQTNENGFGAILAATVKGRIDVVAMLWDAGVGEEVMADESCKRFLMSQASVSRSEGVIKMLEERGLTRIHRERGRVQ